MPEFDVEKIGFLLAETARTWRTKLDQRLKPIGLSQAKWTTLMHLAYGGDKLTQSEIAARIGIEEPTLAGLLDRLQHDGWIKRKSAAHDRRCKTVHLQRRSKTILADMFETARELRHELIRDIPSRDLQRCMRVLRQIRDKAEAVSGTNGIASKNGKRNGALVRTRSNHQKNSRR
jgi:MarR family transcriptional regulator for hemolysin